MRWCERRGERLGVRLWDPGAASGRKCWQVTGPGLPSPSLILPGNSSLGLGLSPSPAPPRLRLRSVWNRILPPHPGRETASCRSCRLEPRVSRLHISLCGVGQGPPSTMVKLGCSFSGKLGKDPGDQDGATTDSVPLISPLDVSQLQPPFSDQVVIKTQTEYELSSMDQPKKFSDLEAQKLACGHPEEGRRLPTARMIAFAMALMGCVLIMYKAIWYDQFTCPDGFLLRHKMCTPLTLEMYYTEMDPERHRSILAAIGAYPLSRKHGTEPPSAWGQSHRAVKEGPKAPTQAGAAGTTESPGKTTTRGEMEAAQKETGSAPPSAPAPSPQ